MVIFAELFLFGALIFGIVDYFRVKVQNKVLHHKIDVLTEKNGELLEKNGELLDLLTSEDVDRIGVPPKGKSILHG